jgi:glycosyltransferase involved in cell wall biosynthesis
MWWRIYCRIMLRKIARSSHHIITGSEFSKRDIVNTFSISEEKVTVTSYGVDKRFHVIVDQELKKDMREKYRLNKPFILYAGSIQPRKNIESLLKAYFALRSKKTIQHQLVFTGGSGWKNSRIYELVERSEFKEDAVFLGYIPDNVLPLLYNSADFLVYPSYFEGFGMPVLEAMACGCPVITSNTSSLPEVAGDAGLLIDPYDVSSLEDAIEQLAHDNTLKQSLIEKGLDQSQRFSWERCALQTLNVYDEIGCRSV